MLCPKMIFKSPKRFSTTDNVELEEAPGLASERSPTLSSMAITPTPPAGDDNPDMTAVWKSVEAPRMTFKIDHSRFYHPAGPLVNDTFWMVLPEGDIGAVSKDGFRLEGHADGDAKERQVKTKDAKSGLTFRCGSWIIDYHPCQSLRRCIIGHGPQAEQRVVARLKTDCQHAAHRVAKCMAGLLWYHLQTYGSLEWWLPEDFANCLKEAAAALNELAGLVSRFIETMRKHYQGGGREGRMPALFKKALVLFGLTKWYRVHRAINSVQCLEKAFRRLACGRRDSATECKAKGFIGSNTLGMLGWGLAPPSLGAQKDVLPEVLASLDILGTVDWNDFETGAVKASMEKTSTAVRIVKEVHFSAWAFRKMLRFLEHQRMDFENLVEVRGLRKTVTWEGRILPAHLRMLEALPCAQSFEVEGRRLVRLVGIC